MSFEGFGLCEQDLPFGGERKADIPPTRVFEEEEVILLDGLGFAQAHELGEACEVLFVELSMKGKEELRLSGGDRNGEGDGVEVFERVDACFLLKLGEFFFHGGEEIIEGSRESSVIGDQRFFAEGFDAFDQAIGDRA